MKEGKMKEKGRIGWMQEGRSIWSVVEIQREKTVNLSQSNYRRIGEPAAVQQQAVSIILSLVHYLSVQLTTDIIEFIKFTYFTYLYHFMLVWFIIRKVKLIYLAMTKTIIHNNLIKTGTKTNMKTNLHNSSANIS